MQSNTQFITCILFLLTHNAFFKPLTTLYFGKYVSCLFYCVVPSLAFVQVWSSMRTSKFRVYPLQALRGVQKSLHPADIRILVMNLQDCSRATLSRYGRSFSSTTRNIPIFVSSTVRDVPFNRYLETINLCRIGLVRVKEQCALCSQVFTNTYVVC
jgi:hypothetical protein